MTLNKFGDGTGGTNGPGIKSAPVNGNFALSITQSGMNLIRQLQHRSVNFSAGQIEGWAEAYNDSSGRKNSVSGAIATFDTDKYAFNDSFDTNTSRPFVVIEADSLTESKFTQVSGVSIIEVSSKKWVVLGNGSDTYAVQRAQIHQALWHGSGDESTTTGDGGMLTVVNCTAIRTNITRDQGKRAHWAVANSTGTASEQALYDGLFDNTTTNTDCSFWSRIRVGAASGQSAAFELPDGTVINSLSSSGTSDHIGDDRESDELDNPASVELRATSGSGAVPKPRAYCIILCEGDITWTDNSDPSNTIVNDVDFFTDYSIPVFTATTDILANELSGGEISHSIPTGTFPSTITTAIGVPLIEDWETGANIQYKLISANEDSGWLDAMNTKPEISTFTAFTSEPTTLIVRLVQKSSSPTTAFPAINGFYVYAS